ncbi:winged helix-turn-helix domain-containing protein [Vibrio sp. Isolate22]|nr:winged helix-turn-helix domain-containing protein [Vibrio sp. Isolate22]
MILSDQVVTQAVFELRKVLKQNSQQHNSYIITVQKRGYKFEADVIQSKIETDQVAEPEPSTAQPSAPEQSPPADKLPQYMVRPVIASRVKNNELICANIFRVY